MDLDTLIQETVKRVVEGGKALGGDRIALADIQPTVAAFAEQFLKPLGVSKYHLLGSTGKKADSGDIDLAVEGASLEQLAARAKELGLPHRVFKGLDQVSVLFPQSAPGKRIQIDCILGDPDYLKWSHPSPADSKYKGFYTRAIANAIIRATTGKHVNVTRGVFSKDDPDKKYSTDLAGLARAIGHGWTSEDLTQSLEKIWAKAKTTFTPEQLEQIRAYVKEFMENKKAPFPEELNEGVVADTEIPWEARQLFFQLFQGSDLKNTVFFENGGVYAAQFDGKVYTWDQRNKGWRPRTLSIVKNEAVRPQAAAHQMERLKDVIIANCPTINKVVEVPQSMIGGSGFATYSPAKKTIFVAMDAPEPYKSFAAAHEAGHVRDLKDPAKFARTQELVKKFRASGMNKEEAAEYLDMEQRAWKEAEWFLQKAGIPVDNRFQARRDKSMSINTANVKKVTINDVVEATVAKIARGIVPGYGNIRPASTPSHSKGAQVGQGNIGGPRNRGTPGYPVPPEMLNKRGQEGESDGGGLEVLEAKDPSRLDWGIKHLDDLKPDEFMEFLKKYADSPLDLEISEKVDGSARMSFGVGGGTIWTQTKTGSRKAMSSQYRDDDMFKPVKEAHKALEEKKDAIIAAWPKDITFMVAEVLYGQVPNAIEYGDNRLIIHGVHGYPNELDDTSARKAAQQVIKAIGGRAGDFKVEYKRTINPKDVMVDVRTEYDTLGALYKSLQQKPRDKEATANFKQIQKQVKDKLVKMLHSQRSAYGPEGGDIEGLVFRDLENGRMYKLVDKDYFKTLVDFMWSWRNRVNKEVMQGFREVVARDALGDTSAAGNRLVSNILASSPGGTGDKDPQRQADLLIANYISKNGLMKPDFYISFHRALMGAFQDLERIKLQWEKTKDEKQSTTIQGKTREMGPDVKDRTTAAIRDAEAALQGIRAGMDVAQNIKDPMTQKVALFKLFMGHRFQRLVDKLSGESLDESIFGPPDDTEERANQLYPDDTGDPEQSPAPKGKAQSWVSHLDTIKANSDKLARRLGRPVDTNKFLGSGASASVFDLGNGKVFKLTKDETDAAASIFFMKHPAEHVVRVFDVFEFPKDPQFWYVYYGIVAEKLYELDTDERNHMDEVSWLMGMVNGRPWAPIQASLEQKGDETSMKALEIARAYGLDKMIDEFAQAGFNTEDFHSGNVMKRKDGWGTMVLSDLGLSTSSGKFMPPKLEKKIYEGGPIDRGTGWTDLGGGQRLDTVGLDDAERANEAAGKWLKGITAATMMGLAGPTAIDNTEPPPVTNIEEPLDISAKSIDQIVDEASAESGVSPILIKAMMSTESGNDPKAVSPKGAKGLMQLMPGTAKAMGATDPHDPEQNVKAAAKYIAKLQKAFHGRLDWVLAAYNMGPNALHKSKGPETYPQETKDYIKRVRAAVKKLKAQQPKPIASAVGEAISRLLEADAPEYVGATIGRFQPFHAGHAKMIRQLAQKYTRVLVFVGGMTKDKNNPFDYDLRLEMMEKSLTDVWSKVRVFPAVAAGKGTGYMPLLLAEVAKAGEIERNQPVSIVVGEDRLPAVRQQVEHYKKYAGEPGYYMGTMEVEAIPGFKNDDDVDRISGTRVRQAIAKGDRNEVRRLLDPHLVSDPASLEDLLVRMETAMKTPKPQATLEAIVEEVMTELGMGGLETGVGFTRGGAWGSSGWSRAILAKGETGDETYQQMMRSPSTRMLPMANHGTPNSDLPGVNRIDGEHEDDQLNKPTDLDEVIEEAVLRILRKRSVVR